MIINSTKFSTLPGQVQENKNNIELLKKSLGNNLEPRGEWSNSILYSAGDIVVYTNSDASTSTYIALTENMNQAPAGPVSEFWQLFSASDVKGAQGEPGTPALEAWSHLIKVTFTVQPYEPTGKHHGVYNMYVRVVTPSSTPLTDAEFYDGDSGFINQLIYKISFVVSTATPPNRFSGWGFIGGINQPNDLNQIDYNARVYLIDSGGVYDYTVTVKKADSISDEVNGLYRIS